MRFLSVLFLLVSTELFAIQYTNLKIDSHWMVKYDPQEWSYIYIKPLAGVSPNLFEHKKGKIRIVLQKESHQDEVLSYKELLEKKCEEVNQYYTRKLSGFSEIITINNKKVCYLEFKNVSGEMTRQFLYPELSKNKNYDLYSYGWNSSDIKSKEIVINFLKGFL